MSEAVADPYTVRAGEARPAPTALSERLKHLGPGVVVTGSIVGSGELILTSTLGAAAGFALLWWVLLACWSKSLVQAELARYAIVSGDTYLRALNRLPGRLPGPGGPVAWPIWIGLLAFVPTVAGLGGIIGGAGQGLALLVPFDANLASGLVALVVAVILGSGSYLGFERVMLVLVMSFTIATLVCAITMQGTPFGMTGAHLADAFSFSFPLEHLTLALAVYGYTGVNAAEVAAYTYWCVEKGYPSYIGADRDDPAWPERARGWIRVLQTDVWVTLGVLTLATVPFYLLGAGVLHGLGLQPQGTETVRMLSSMFTETLGAWAYWLFGIGAFLILFSTTLSGIGAGGRVVTDYLTVLGFLDRTRLRARVLWIRGYVTVVPLVGFLFYLTIQEPVVLVSVGAMAAALLAPIQSGATLWLQSRRMDPRVRPGRSARAGLGLIFAFQIAMAWLVVRYVVLR